MCGIARTNLDDVASASSLDDDEELPDSDSAELFGTIFSTAFGFAGNCGGAAGGGCGRLAAFARCTALGGFVLPPVDAVAIAEAVGRL